jgi:hypothetical protein
MTEAVAAHALPSLLLPFLVVSLGLAWLARARLAALATGAGYAVAHVAIAGAAWPSAGATARLAWSVAGATLVGIALERSCAGGRAVRGLLAAASGAAGVWLVGLALAHRPAPAALVAALVVCGYCAWVAAAVDRAADDPVRGAIALMGTGFATAGTVALSGSALIGELAAAVGASAAAAFAAALAGALRGRLRGAAYPLSIAVALCGAAAFELASLRWYGLVALAGTPAVAQIPLPRGWPRLLEIAARLLFTLSWAGASIALTRRLEGGIPL